MISSKQNGGGKMRNYNKPLVKSDIMDGKKISDIFENLQEGDKSFVLGYIFALRDKNLISENHNCQ